MTKTQDNNSQIHQLLKIILAEADRLEESAAASGGWGSGGTDRLREQVKYYKYGMNCSIPSEWKSYQVQLDPEYQKYLELKKKFESK